MVAGDCTEVTIGSPLAQRRQGSDTGRTGYGEPEMNDREHSQHSGRRGPPDLERAADRREAAREERRRATRARVRRQRLAAGAVLALALILFLGFVWPGFFGGSGGPGSASGDTGTETPAADGQGSGAPSAAKSPGQQGATSGKPKPLRTPTEKLPLRLKLYGDSVGGDLAWAMYMKAADHPQIKYWRFAKPSTGIVRPDYFSWPGHFREDLAHHSYGAVVFMSGANDGQGMVVDGHAQAFGSPAWLKEYHRRVGAAMDLFLKNRVKRVYWVGMPEMGDPEFSALMADINEVAEAEAKKRAPAVRFIDAWAILDGPSGDYVAAYRQPDGVHLSDKGSFKLADAVYGIIEKEWHITATADPSGSPSP